MQRTWKIIRTISAALILISISLAYGCSSSDSDSSNSSYNLTASSVNGLRGQVIASEKIENQFGDHEFISNNLNLVYESITNTAGVDALSDNTQALNQIYQQLEEEGLEQDGETYNSERGILEWLKKRLQEQLKPYIKYDVETAAILYHSIEYEDQNVPSYSGRFGSIRQYE